MNVEEIQSLWGSQTPADLRAPGFIDRQRKLVRDLKQRQRMLGYNVSLTIFALIATPLLSVKNYLYDPSAGTPLYWVRLGLLLVVMVASAILVVRRLQRQRALVRTRVSTLREQAEVSFANLEAERRDYRNVPWVLAIWTGLTMLSIYVNKPFHGGSFDAIALRAGPALGVYALIGVLLWRHYRVNLCPAHARQQEILHQLS